MKREFPDAPLVGVGAVVVNAGRVLLIRRGSEPLKGHWSLPGGLVEVGENLHQALQREVAEETGLQVEPIHLLELVERVHRKDSRVQYHYVIAEYLCRFDGGKLRAASDAAEADWVEFHQPGNPLQLDAITLRVIQAGFEEWQRRGPERLGRT
jgi:ADP-ribose pyrophosphatase YjhB (NUDIX family)